MRGAGQLRIRLISFIADNAQPTAQLRRRTINEIVVHTMCADDAR